MKIEYLEKYKNSLYSALSHYEEVDNQEGTETVDKLKEEIVRAISIISEYPEAFQKSIARRGQEPVI